MFNMIVFLLFLTRRTADGALLSYPSDRNVTVGEHVILPCATDLDLPVYWFFNGHEIFYGGKVSMSFQSMFSVSSSKTGEYNLVISSADASYNGEYACGDDEGQGEKKSAYLHVTAAAVTVTVAATGVATDGDVNTGMIIGLFIGIVLLLAIVIAVVCLYRRLVKKREQRPPGKQELQDPEGRQPNGSEIYGTAAYPTNNLCEPLLNLKTDGDVVEVKEHVARPTVTDLTGRNLPAASPKSAKHQQEQQPGGSGGTSPYQTEKKAEENRTSPSTPANNTQQQQQHPFADTPTRPVTGGGEVVTENFPKPHKLIKIWNKGPIPENKSDTPNSNVAASRPMGARTQDDTEPTASNAAPSNTEATTEDSEVGHMEVELTSAVDTKHCASSRPTTPINIGFRVIAGSPASVKKQTEQDTTSSNESKVANEDTKEDFSVTDSPGGDSRVQGAQSSTPPKAKPRQIVSPNQKEDGSNQKPELPPKPGKNNDTIPSPI